ncbi:MAG: hypothetical protein IPK16_03285 [Anaerolineales bacterium]|nr:hypothetical protein [Anaerolineales bacterium]
MLRKSLTLMAAALILTTALFLQLSAVQAAPQQQETAADTPAPLPQPLRITIRQLIPSDLESARLGARRCPANHHRTRRSR